MEKITKIIKNNTRYILVLTVIVLAVLVNKNFLINNTVTSDDCKDGKCPGVLDEINLSDENPVYFSNDLLNSSLGEYYRLSFKQRSEGDTSVLVKETNAFDEENIIKTVELKKSNKESFQEILFRSSGKKTDIKFEKKDANDGIDVKIYSVRVSKLNVRSEDEFSKLNPTINGEVNFDEEDQEQTKDSSEKFMQSSQEGILIGQVFKPDVDYITGVSLDMDITRAGEGDPRRYSIQLRKADFDGESLEVGKAVLAEQYFSLNTVERYRQEDGKLKFPLFSRLEKGGYYFLGINNDNGQPDKFNNIVMRGSSDRLKYPNGIIGVKAKGMTYTQSGALYFVTYGASFKKNNGKEILSNSMIEDLGKGKGLFVYDIGEFGSNLIDLYSSSDDVKFDNEKKAIYASTGEKSYFEYKFYTGYPFEKIKISGNQPDEKWSKTAISYSYDEKNWKEIPFNSISQVQTFDYEITNENLADADTVYLKFTPYYPEEDQKQFGLEDFRVEADLLIK